MKQEQTKYKKAELPQLVKLEKVGDFVEGKFVSITESKTFSKSYALKYIGMNGKPYSVFVNSLAYDLIIQNLVSGQKFKLIFESLQKSQEGGKEYKVYELLYE